jgi:thiol-disulfide isomerase/thioredoxin
VRLDLDGQALDFLLLDLTLPASGREATLDFCPAEILAGPVAFSNLQESFDTFIGRESSLAVIAKTPSANRSTILNDSRIADAVIVVSAKWTSHGTLGSVVFGSGIPIWKFRIAPKVSLIVAEFLNQSTVQNAPLATKIPAIRGCLASYHRRSLKKPFSHSCTPRGIPKLSMSNDSNTDPSTVALGSPRSTTAYKYLLYAGLFMLLGISFLIFLGRERQSFAGRQIPDLDLKPLLNATDGPTELIAKSDYVLLHFWGTWCGPCVQEYPDIIKLQRKYAEDSRVAILSVSCGTTTPESTEELEFNTKIFVQGVGGDLPVYCDPAMYSRIQVANIIGRTGFAYPTSLLLDKNRKIVDAWIGSTGPGELERAIEKALKTPSPAAAP